MNDYDKFKKNIRESFEKEIHIENNKLKEKCYTAWLIDKMYKIVNDYGKTTIHYHRSIEGL